MTRTRTPAGVYPPCCSRLSCPLNVSLIDSMIWRSGLKNWAPGRSGSPLRAGRNSRRPAWLRVASKLSAEVVLVPDDELTGPVGGRGLAGEDVEQHLAFVGLGAGECEADGEPVQGAQQVQPQPPEIAGVRCAVPVLRPPGQVGAARGLPGPPAFHRSGVDHPHVIGPQGGVSGQRADQPVQRGRQPAQPLVISRLLRKVGEQVPQVGCREPQPPGLGGETQQRLHHCQGHHLGVRDPRSDPDSRAPRHLSRLDLQQIIGPDVECGREGVQVGVHEGLRFDVGSATSILGALHPISGATRRITPLGIDHLDINAILKQPDPTPSSPLGLPAVVAVGAGGDQGSEAAVLGPGLDLTMNEPGSIPDSWASESSRSRITTTISAPLWRVM